MRPMSVFMGPFLSCHFFFYMNFIPNPALVSFRLLLICIAILSAYSIHLLLKSAGVVGKSAPESTHITQSMWPRGWVLHLSHCVCVCVCVCVMSLGLQAFELMSSLGTGLLVPQEKCWPPSSLRYTTSEVLSCHSFHVHVWYLWVKTIG